MIPLLNTPTAAWSAATPVVAAGWSRKDARLAFAFGDGTVGLADGPARSQPGFDTGGVTASEPRRLRLHEGGCLAFKPDAEEGWLWAGEDGCVLRLLPDGYAVPLARPNGAWVDLLAGGRPGVRAWASGRHLVCQVDGLTVDTGLPKPATAIAFDPAGQVLAAAHHGGVTLWSVVDGTTQLIEAPGYPRALAWSPDGRYLLAGMQENGLHGWRIADSGEMKMGGYPGQPLSLSFACDGRFLATSGAMQPVCWNFDPPRGDVPQQCGVPSRVPVTQVACHPFFPMVAAGYDNGAVTLCRPGTSEIVLIAPPGGGAINAIVWSPDGRQLALGSQGGNYGWVSLPQALFRKSPARSEHAV